MAKKASDFPAASSAWDFITLRLPHLECLGAGMSCRNGGSSMESRMFFCNHLGLEGDHCFTHSRSDEGFFCPDAAVQAFELVDPSHWESTALRRTGKVRLVCSVQTKAVGHGDPTRGWAAHEAVLRRYFNDDTVKMVKLVMLDERISEERRCLGRLRTALAEARRA